MYAANDGRSIADCVGMKYAALHIGEYAHLTKSSLVVCILLSSCMDLDVWKKVFIPKRLPIKSNGDVNTSGKISENRPQTTAVKQEKKGAKGAK